MFMSGKVQGGVLYALSSETRGLKDSLVFHALFVIELKRRMVGHIWLH